MADDFLIRFWGVRGSIACGGADYAVYGGNTSCLEVRCGGRLMIFDGGTGIRPLGEAIAAEAPLDVGLYLTHTHFDHICGLPFFQPLFDPANRFEIWSGHLTWPLSTRDAVHSLMSAPVLPIEPDIFRANVAFRDFKGGETLVFGRDYLIPRPFDPRLIERVAYAVAKAAMDSGVASRPIDLEAYRERLARYVYQSGNIMRPVFAAAKSAPKRVIYAEGEEENVLRAVQVVVDEKLAHPVLLGRADVIARRIENLGLRLKVGENCEVVNILSDSRYAAIVKEYYALRRRKGVTQAAAKEVMRSRASAIAAMLLRRGVPMEQKPFQMGVRIEQPQETVNRVKYGRSHLEDTLGAADYNLVAHGPHDLFTFCMCAGGYIIPSVSEEGFFCTNGMSLSTRASPFALSDTIVTGGIVCRCEVAEGHHARRQVSRSQ